MSVKCKEKSKDAWVGMGDTVIVRAPECAKSVLGSCIGLVLYAPELKIAAVAHVVLPKMSNRKGPEGKFADTAVPYMLKLLGQEGVAKGGLIAKIAGGSRMLGGNGPFQIGDANSATILKALKASGIPLQAKDIGGEAGRRISFDAQSGAYVIEVAGKAPAFL